MRLFPHSGRRLLPVFCAAALFLPPLVCLAVCVHVNLRFVACTRSYFVSDAGANALTLHYTLEHPEDYGISSGDGALSSFTADDLDSDRPVYENRLSVLKDFPVSLLSEKNRLTAEILTLAYETELDEGNRPLLAEFLSPMIGTQAQLPVLLAEYAFRSESDVAEYLTLLASVPDYIQSILSVEREKAASGLFMSDTGADRVIEQCQAFIADPEDNYLISVFEEKLDALDGLDGTQREACRSLNRRIVTTRVVPAYQEIIDTLSALKGSGVNEGGLCYLEGGRAYYEYLLKSDCGLYESVEEIRTRLLAELSSDLSAASEILARRPALAVSQAACEYASLSPEEMLSVLCEKMSADFPAAPETEYSVKCVHEDLAPYLSPAFYLTPPADTLSPNDIYINPQAQTDSLDLFTTLGHEGYPGHLFQTVTFAASSPDPIRYLLNMGGYVEGWATYCESYAYSYASGDADAMQLAWLNRSVSLCLYSLLDIGIHYNGWLLADVCEYLADFGISDPETCREIYQTIVETPANYVKYCAGALHFRDLADAFLEKEGNGADLAAFHGQILAIGPCQFPILEKWMADWTG